MTDATPTTARTDRRIPLTAIALSKSNPRKSFDKAALAELAESIKRHDVLQPILVRPNGGEKFEVVAGERRFRAAKDAGLTDIPATVRTLTDAEVLEIQVVENLQRADLHELEEAEGYEQLLKCAHADGKKYSVEEIAAKVGKSRSYVFARLKLTALCPEARKAFYAGELDASRALLIARIGHHDTQRQALKAIVEGRYKGDEPMSYREAHQHILQNYMLALREAPFDTKDEKLLPKAGACGPCPKRTGNQADLFGDVKSADVCTDPKCFDDKRQAHYLVAARALEAKGNKVITGEAAKKAFPHWDSGSNYSREQLSGGYQRLDDTSYASGRSRKVADLLGAEYKPILVQHPGTGQIIKVATAQAVAAAAQKNAKGSKSTKSRASQTTGSKERKPSDKELFRRRLFTHICAALPKKLGADELRWILGEILRCDPEFELLEELFFPGAKGGKGHGLSQRRIETALAKLEVDNLSRLAVAAVLSIDVNEYVDDARLMAAAKTYGVDVTGIKASLKAEAETPKEKTSAPASKKKAKK